MNTAVKALDLSLPGRETFKRLESEVRSYCRTVPAVFVSASGSELRDQGGRRYLDFLAGAGSLNYGHNHPALKQALLDYVAGDGITHSLDLHTAAKQRFLETFQRHILAPRDLHYVTQFTGPTGANAVEAALKLARKVTGRQNVVTFTNAFHGVTLGALAVTGNRHHRDAAGLSLAGSVRAPYDGYLGEGVDTLDYLEKALDDASSGFGHPAAVIVETLQGEGGLNEAGASWLQRLEALCRQRDILLIVDDIQAGCGRSGGFFSFEAAGIRPHMVTLSKSLSGYGLPMATLLIDPDLDQWQPGEHNGTFRGNNHAFVTAAAAVDTFWTDGKFAAAVGQKAARLRRGLEAIAGEVTDLPMSVRGRGFMIGLACESADAAPAICRAAYRRGLIIETSGPRDEVVKCLPALTTPAEQLDRGLEILADSIREVAGS